MNSREEEELKRKYLLAKEAKKAINSIHLTLKPVYELIDLVLDECENKGANDICA